VHDERGEKFFLPSCAKCNSVLNNKEIQLAQIRLALANDDGETNHRAAVVLAAFD